MLLRSLLVVGIALPVLPSTSAAAIIAPTTTVQSISHRYSPSGTNPTGSTISDNAVLNSSSLTTNPAQHNRFVAQLRAPDGYKFVAEPAPALYDTTLLLILSWGGSTANPARVVSEPAVFENLVGAAPAELMRADYIDTFGSLARGRATFDVNDSFEFTAITLAFSYSGDMTDVERTLSPQPFFSASAQSSQAGLPDASLLRLVAVPEPTCPLGLLMGGALLIRRGKRSLATMRQAI
jgi:hypothetical protein